MIATEIEASQSLQLVDPPRDERDPAAFHRERLESHQVLQRLGHSLGHANPLGELYGRLGWEESCVSADQRPLTVAEESLASETSQPTSPPRPTQQKQEQGLQHGETGNKRGQTAKQRGQGAHPKGICVEHESGERGQPSEVWKCRELVLRGPEGRQVRQPTERIWEPRQAVPWNVLHNHARQAGERNRARNQKRSEVGQRATAEVEKK